MSQKPKFDPSRVATLLETGAKEGGALLPERAPVAPLPRAEHQPEPTTTPAPLELVAESDQPDDGTAIKRPITVRLSEKVLHALVRHQAEMRCKPGARLGDTTIGGVMDTLLRGPLGLA